MYYSSDVAQRVKLTAKEKNVSVKKMLEDIGLGFNMLTNMKKSMPKADNLAMIADYLNCSVDYLLGRTNTVSITNTGDVTGNNNILGQVNGSVAISGSAAEMSELETELMKIFKKLDIKERMKILQFAYEINDNVK